MKKVSARGTGSTHQAPKMVKLGKKGAPGTTIDLVNGHASSQKSISTPDISGLGAYEECLESLAAAKDDSKRVSIMSQVITHLNHQLNELRQQLAEFQAQATKEKEDLQG